MRSANLLVSVALAVISVAGAARAGEIGVTDDEVLLGEPAAFSGPSAGLGIEMWRGAAAAFKEANDAGGVAGRKVRLVLADDAYDAARAAGAVKRLISQDKVFALFGGVGTPTIVKALPVVLKYHLSEGLFYFANFTGAEPQREPPYAEAVFNVRASYREETKTIVDALVAAGRKKVGIFVQDDAYGASGRDGVKRALAAHGLKLAADTTYARGQKFEASASAQVDILRAARVDAIVAVGAYQACGALVRDARAGGLAVPICNVSFVGADQLLGLLRVEGARAGSPLTARLFNTQVVPPYADETVPLVQSYRRAMEKFGLAAPQGVGDGSYLPTQAHTFGSLEGYMSARAFLIVLEKTGRDLTRKRFYEAAEALGKFDLGVGAPAELSAARHQALGKVWFTTVTDDRWAVVEDPVAAVK